MDSRAVIPSVGDTIYLKPQAGCAMVFDEQGWNVERGEQREEDDRAIAV
jgi:hypothetical protein